MKERLRTINRVSVLATLFLFFCLTPASFGQRAPFPIPDPDPEIERKSFVVADGFEVNLFAADPLIAKPLQMNFDPAGRLWIASSEVYPQIAPGAVADDRVLILDDRDHDGRADATTVFAHGLLIPTGIAPGDGGVYVANSTELLHLKDTNADGKADVTRVVLSGFGTEDTHHILHTLRWGYDGMLYFNQSIYIHSHIETPRGVRRIGGGGIWQFRPETMELEVFIRGLVNPWGHHFDRWGQSFATDGAGGEGINYCVPGAYYYTAPDAVRIIKGLNPGSPKYCGLEVASGRHLPETWRGSLLTNDFRGNRVCRFVLADDGSGFVAREQPELIKSKHMAFRPIDIKMGPDGAIYIADWYNPIIQHGEVDFRDPRRDHTRGRIWRVTAKGRPHVDRPQLVGASIDELLDDLKAPEDWTRQQAKRVLKERDRAALIPKLASWVKQLDPHDPEFEHHRLEAVWTYQTLDIVEPALLTTLLGSKDAHVRAAAVRVVPFWKNRLSNPQSLLAARVIDAEPRVRLEAVRSLAQLGGLKSASLALEALDQPIDTYLEYALWLTARQLAPDWLPAVQAGRFDFDGRPGRLIFALRAVDSPAIVKPLLAVLAKGAVPKEMDESVLSSIARLGEPADLALVLNLVIDARSMTGPRRISLLNTLVRATRDRKVTPAGDLTRIRSLLANGEVAMRESAVRAIGAWKVAALHDRLVELVGAGDTAGGVRAAAIEALVQITGPKRRQAIERLAESGAPEVQARVLAALLEAEPRKTMPRVVAWLRRLPPDQFGAAAIALARVLELRGAPGLLASGLNGQPAGLPADLAKICVRQIRASGRNEPALITAFEKAGQLKEGVRKLSDREMAQLLADIARTGDPARGEAIYRRKDMNCQKCHAIAGAGGQVGPGLESIGASAQPDYLVDSLIEPGKAVKENYHALVVATSDGKIYTGIKIRQDDRDLVIRDAEDHEVAIPTASIEEQKMAGSLMPAGLIDGLTRPELVDLVRFLSQLGKIGQFSAGTERVLRRWQVLEPTPDVESTLGRQGLEGLLKMESSLNWRSAYTTVAGELPLSEWSPQGAGTGIVAFAVARTQLEVTTPGKVKLTFNTADGLSVWLDGRRIAPTSDAPRSVVIDVTRGLHNIAVAVDLSQRHAGIRCVLADVPGSPARARAVLGK